MRCRCVLFTHWRDACKAHAVAMAACAIVGDANVVHRCAGEVGELGRSVAGLASQAGR